MLAGWLATHLACGAPVATEAATPATTTFPSLLAADLPQAGWRNPEEEKMRSLLKHRLQAAKRATVHHKPLSASSGEHHVHYAGRRLAFELVP